MKTQMVHWKAILAGALLLALSAAPARAGVCVLYHVGYGLYPYGAADVTSTAPGSGLLANNGSGRALVQLLYAGPDHIVNPVDLGNSLAGYVSGDDQVWQTTVIESGMNDTDEWGFSNIPLAYTNLAWATAGFAFVRVFQDETPGNGDAFYESSLLALDTTATLDGIFSQPLVIGDRPPASPWTNSQSSPPPPSPAPSLPRNGTSCPCRWRSRPTTSSDTSPQTPPSIQRSTSTIRRFQILPEEPNPPRAGLPPNRTGSCCPAKVSS